ncbi:MAG TPA: DNA polymerase III subunit gamma/tau [Burkholderiaceae bacterium]|nr:DNA polymerase III subunit gamma/tau [Burkholderiaceae bacterium]
MTYVVLARKYRPRDFTEMVGQEHVVRSLSNALTQRRLHHAYLFTGTRGVGKTTVSRVLAKSLNCVGADGQGGITAQPCGACQACRDIDAGRFVDYIELDAASHRGVDEITQLLDQAIYKPVLGRFKVYMIDEVHMLTNTAFNAMLKTLEEPPEYLKFVLATTDPQKVPVTVLSRCLQFNLRPMAAETVLEHLQRVLQAEGIEAEPGALRLLARAARGSMRDALSLTDQAIAYGAGRVDEAAVRHMLGSVDRAHVLRLVEALAAFDGAAVVQTVDELRSAGLSAAGTLEELAMLAQEMAVLQAVPEAADAVDPHVRAVQRLAGLMPADETQLLYSLALHGRAELGLAPDEYSALVMVLLRMLAFKPAGEPGARAEPRPRGAAQGAPSPRAADASVLREQAAPAVPSIPAARPVAAAPAVLAATEPPPPVPAPARAEPIERQVVTQDQPAVSAEPVRQSPPAQASSRIPDEAPAAASVAQPDESPRDLPKDLPKNAPATHAHERWITVVGTLLERGAVTALVRELAWQSQCLAIDEAATPPRWTLQVERESLRQPALRERLEAALRECLGAAAALGVEAGPVTDSAARRDAAARAQAQARAEAIIRDDPAVVALMQQFKGARIVPGSVRPA